MLVVQERDASNVVTRGAVWGLSLGGGIGGLLNLAQAGQNYSYLYDGSGNVEAVLNSSQAVVAAYRYDPFGNLEAKTGTLTQPYLFSTKRYDAQTGLYDFGVRFYSPAMPRWMTRDPLGEAGGLNLYAFVGNNPVNWVDPWGLATFDASGIINANQAIRRHAGFLPNWILDLFFPVTLSGIADDMSGAVMGMVCPINVPVGQTFGKLGTVIQKPGLNITGFVTPKSQHGLHQAISRMVRTSWILNTVRNPRLVFQQVSGNFLYLSDEAVVVLNKYGKVVTTYGNNCFDDVIKTILAK